MTIMILMHIIILLLNFKLQNAEVLRLQPATKGLKKELAYNKVEIQKIKDAGLLNCPQFKANITKKFDDIIKTINSSEVVLISSCNDKKYILTKFKVNPTLRWQYCLKYGMLSASIETITEVQCIEQYIQQHKVEFPKLSNELLFFKRMFMTAQMDVTATRKFTSCVTGREISDEIWTNGEPDNMGKNEAYIVFNPTRSSRYISGLMDIPCALTPMRIICEYGSDAQRLLYTTEPNLQQSNLKNKQPYNKLKFPADNKISDLEKKLEDLLIQVKEYRTRIKI